MPYAVNNRRKTVNYFTDEASVDDGVAVGGLRETRNAAMLAIK